LEGSERTISGVEVLWESVREWQSCKDLLHGTAMIKI